MAEANRKFDLVTDPNEALGMLREASKSVASTIVWTKNQESVINTTVHLFSEAEQTIYVAFPNKEFDPRGFVDAVAKSGTRECFFSISLQRSNAFFKAAFIGYDAGLKFKAPEQVFKVQRRTDLRFAIPSHVTMRSEFQDPLFPDKKLGGKIIDLSASGMAIVVNDDDAALFTANLILNGVSFTCNQRAIQCKAEVRHVSPHKIGGEQQGHKVGLLFKEIAEADAKHIGAWVFDENRKWFQTFVQG